MNEEMRKALKARAIAILEWTGDIDASTDRAAIDIRHQSGSVTAEREDVRVTCWDDGDVSFNRLAERMPAVQRICEAHPLPKVSP